MSPAQHTPFTAGDIITRREMLHGGAWLEHPVTVVDDDGETLAVRLDPGSRFTFPAHPFGPHPWSDNSAWGGTTVLQVNRPGDLYGVWKFFDLDGRFLHWYINFEPRQVRRERAIETDDYGLDLIVFPDGRREWKDVEDLHHQRVEGRIVSEVVEEVLRAAADVIALLDADRRWWAAWDDWSPVG